jgi:hypothetical protein
MVGETDAAACALVECALCVGWACSFFKLAVYLSASAAAHGSTTEMGSVFLLLTLMVWLLRDGTPR